MAETKKGLIIVHTGPGKGKTTAALGLALRAVGSGLKVLMVQFIKGSWHYGELDAAKAFGDKFVLRPMGRGFVKLGGEIDPEDKRAADEAWAFAREKIFSGEYDMIILDEINYAISYGLLAVGPVLDTLKRKPEMVHVVLTGRNAPADLIALADLVTEMREVKHPYQKGIEAQRGIEY
ncbi:MAG: cob(I)yrinic acid a,c-diamide adenosyltransferase [Acidobacteria bacterium RIFCSPHIGHO2_12_FULL_67_30]|nr:MAG: cob(I)yrinic acid a,c-diamide adenosyltransferase [Acidobacteria bacterium RIFCSPHIGHO2_02_FULL_67_57]OFV85071.1 MAG: cob(I)yrinic acid a,c-diamide adenosyltransferase [Acidobacteria bacterium RIFCSPHIGHO2_01_FULL_67_28]OFV87040.1 MAG: cob(I)yrinic acid a,c-diamide adenosyltransferase [Acidobacteria bacterium RIFCSPHIGHO2_12_FULL_67_30]